MDDLKECRASFIRKLEFLEPQMVAIAREFDRIAAKDKAMSDVAGLVAAPFTGAGGLVAAVGGLTGWRHHGHICKGGAVLLKVGKRPRIRKTGDCSAAR